MQTDEKSQLTEQKTGVPKSSQENGLPAGPQITLAIEHKHDHHNSAIYAASHVHSAVGHVKPHHNNRIDL